MTRTVIILFSLTICNTSLFGQQKPELILPIAHSSPTHFISYSYDNQYLLTGSDDKTAKIWDVNSGSLLHDLKGHTGGVVCGYFSKDNQYVLTSGFDPLYGGKEFSAKLWSVATGEVAHTFEHANQINFSTFNNSGKLIATGSQDLTAKIWDSKSGKLLFTLEPKGDVIKVLFSPDDKLIVTASSRKISIWEGTSGKLIKQIATSSTKDIAFTIDGKSIIETESYTKDRTKKHSVNLWDVETATLKYKLSTDSDPISNFSLSPDGKYLSTSDNRITIIWDLNNYSIYKKLDNPYAVIFDRTNNYLIASNKVYNLKSWEVVSNYKGRISEAGIFGKSNVSNQLSSDNKYIAGFNGANGDIIISNLLTGAEYRKLSSHCESIHNVTVSPQGNFIAFKIFSDPKIRIIDGNTGKIVIDIKSKDYFYTVNNLAFTNDETKIIVSAKDTYVYEVMSGKLVKVLPSNTSKNIYAITSPDDKLLVTEESDALKIWDFEKGNVLHKIMGDFYRGSATFSNDGKLIGAPISGRKLAVIEASSGKILQTIETPVSDFNDCSFSPDGKYIVAGDGYMDGHVFNVESGKLIRKLTKHKVGLVTSKFSPDGKQIITTDMNGSAIIWDAKSATTVVEEPWSDTTATVVSTFNLEKNAYRYNTSFSFAKNWLVINSNNEIGIYDLKNHKKVLGWVGIDEDDYMIYLPNNYYTVTPYAARWLKWKIGNNLYDFDQWDIKFNRPDLVLKALQNKDAELIEAYEATYHKRLKKLDIDSTMFQDDFKLPEITIVKNTNSGGKGNVSKLKIIAEENAPNTYLRKIHVSVNGNPVYGKNGYIIPDSKSKKFTLDVDLPLNAGVNQIKVSCLNNRGAESVRKKTTIDYEPSQKRAPKVWFVGIGVSKYKDENYNLEYAAKDVNDISKLLSSKPFTFESILLLDENATKEKILAVNKKLREQAQPDDIIVLSLSGHGLIDKDYNFYFATHDVDFENPESRGLSYEDIENLLDKVVSSKKLVLLDACHSGEFDADEFSVQSNIIKDKNVTTSTRGFTRVKKKNNLNNFSSFQLLQELFTSTNSSNGSTVISAAAGNEYAYEGQGWDNGVFTYCVLSAMKEKKGDLDGNGEITISELQKRVSKEVTELTDGKQKPTSRQINFENDWIIW